MRDPSAATCREVAPLIARFSDPELSESEQVLLSTHLMRCASCRELLDHYRRHDRALRSFAPIPVAPRVRSAIYAELAAQAPPYRLSLLTTIAATALAVMFVTSLIAARSRGADGFLGRGQELPADALTQSITSTRLVSNAMSTNTPRASAVSLLATFSTAAPSSQPVPPLTGTVAALSLVERRLVLRLSDSETDESLAITTATAIRFLDGRVADLADLAVGTPVHVLCDRDAGGLIATVIVVLR